MLWYINLQGNWSMEYNRLKAKVDLLQRNHRFNSILGLVLDMDEYILYFIIEFGYLKKRKNSSNVGFCLQALYGRRFGLTESEGATEFGATA